jgi:hypothetical protein
VIEIDGWSHNYKEEYDFERENYLKSLGLKIFKIPDIEIKKNLSWVMGALKDFIVAEYGFVWFSYGIIFYINLFRHSAEKRNVLNIK